MDTSLELTPKQILSSLEDLAMQMTKFDEHRITTLPEIIDQLDLLYRAAAGNDSLQDVVVQVDNRIRGLAHMTEEAISSAKFSVQFAAEMNVLIERLAQEHSELYNAVENDNRRHPLVGGLAEKVHAEAFEAGEEYGNRSAMAHELVEYLMGILRAHPDSPAACGKFMDIWFGKIELTDSQIDGFLAWLASV